MKGQIFVFDSGHKYIDRESDCKHFYGPTISILGFAVGEDFALEDVGEV